MTKATPAAGSLPNGSIDFDKVQANARAGKSDIYEGAVSHVRGAKPAEEADEPEEVTGKGPEPKA